MIRVSARSPSGFFRAGRFWPQAGELVDPADLGVGVEARLRAEPNLLVEDVAADAAAAAPADLAELLRQAIAALPPEGFGANGAPNLAPLRAALGENGRHVTAALRDEVWAGVQAARPKDPQGA